MTTMEATLPPRVVEGPGWPSEVAQDLAYLRTGIVNVVFVGPRDAGDRGWVLIDAGLPGYAGFDRSCGRAAIRPGCAARRRS